MTRDIPLRTRRPKKTLELDTATRASTVAGIPVPEGSSTFKEGFRECLDLYALHKPDKRRVRWKLEQHAVLLSTVTTREAADHYAGFRQGLKELERAKRIKPL
jgi:hypothetical protein